MSVDKTDPALQFPYKIAEPCINNVLASCAQGQTWAKAMKFLLTDLKWATILFIKHQNINNRHGLRNDGAPRRATPRLARFSPQFTSARNLPRPSADISKANSISIGNSGFRLDSQGA